MLGTLRFILAALVALSHIGWLPSGINPGIAAVVVFYMISGYVVANLWNRLQNQHSPLRLFYSDRFIRIYPAYFFVMALGVATLLILRPQSYYLSGDSGVAQWLQNLLIVPLNYYMYNEADRFVFIPPAWSLGAEIQFYLVLPLLLRCPRLVFVLSLAVAVLAQTGFLPREWFTYRLLPGVLHVFMAGALLATARDSRQLYLRAAVIWAVYGACALMLLVSGQMFAHREPELYVLGMLNIAPELLMGLLIGLPLVVMLAPLRSRKFDQRLGDFSYGVFLNHFIVYWALSQWVGPDLNVPLYMCISVLISIAGWYLVEQPCKRWRYGLRKANQAPDVLTAERG